MVVIYNNPISTKTIRLRFHIIYIFYCIVYLILPPKRTNIHPNDNRTSDFIYTSTIHPINDRYIVQITNMALLPVSNVLFIP